MDLVKDRPDVAGGLARVGDGHANGAGPDFPRYRPRRLRRSPALRRMVAETHLSPADFIYPLFITHGRDVRREIASMPGVYQWSVDRLPAEVEAIAALGVPAVILFGIPAIKDEIGSENFAPEGITQQAIRAIKAAVPELLVLTDVCMCEYTSHGHCGIIHEGGKGTNGAAPSFVIANDETLDVLGRVAVSHAEAGADVVAPSGMMDGQVAAIRRALDGEGFVDVAIMAYSAKYASAFYGPFRDAAESPPQFGNRRSHQMDPANVREAMREIALDIREGADIVMVKPALAYLDVIRAAREQFAYPLAAYNVSGEYSMVKAAGRNGWIDERAVTLELLTGMKRAGADMILTYFAREVAAWLNER
ncbi:MAG TPA: porphobilinogen synthase [Ardenticatenaceae bacterium]|nr:porphobilinogen synthase [Ardenticatenaceae bacterium]